MTELGFLGGLLGEGYMVERFIGALMRLRRGGSREDSFVSVGAVVGISIVGGVLHGWCGESAWVACLGRKKLVIEDWGKLVLLDLKLKSIVLRVVDGFPYEGFCFSEVSNFFDFSGFSDVCLC